MMSILSWRIVAGPQVMNRSVRYDDAGTTRIQEILNYLVGYCILSTMGRPKNFRREQVLERALPVFWKHGFSDTSLQELERATGVNKSGLYSEFRDKEDLFVACLRHYLEGQEKRGLLTMEPLGWNNVETFLKHGPLNKEEQKGCFSVNSMREFAILPHEAHAIVAESRATLQRLLAMNIAAEKPRMDPRLIAEMVLAFFSGLCIERNLKSGRASSTGKIGSLMKILRNL